MVRFNKLQTIIFCLACLLCGLSGCYLFNPPEPSRISGRVILVDSMEPVSDGAIIVTQEQSDNQIPPNYSVVRRDTFPCSSEGYFDFNLEQGEGATSFFIRAGLFNSELGLYESQDTNCAPFPCGSLFFNREYEDLEVVIYPN